jgi:hypothetical protein
MKNPIQLASATLGLLVGASGIGAGLASAEPAQSGHSQPPSYVSQCKQAKDKEAGVTTSLFNSSAEMDVGEFVEGLTNWFCVFENEIGNQGQIDVATLGSERPSIGATYLLKGLDLYDMGFYVEEPPYPWGDGNPATWVCEQILGTSITRYTNGGFTSPGGEDEVCVFADGSKISTWVLIYVSLTDPPVDNPPGPDYLSMRKAVQSEPIPNAMDFFPYLGDLPLPNVF